MNKYVRQKLSKFTFCPFRIIHEKATHTLLSAAIVYVFSPEASDPRDKKYLLLPRLWAEVHKLKTSQPATHDALCRLSMAR